MGDRAGVRRQVGRESIAIENAEIILVRTALDRLNGGTNDEMNSRIKRSQDAPDILRVYDTIDVDFTWKHAPSN